MNEKNCGFEQLNIKQNESLRYQCSLSCAIKWNVNQFKRTFAECL